MDLEVVQFPYVQICPDCNGTGWEFYEGDTLYAWGGEVVRTIGRKETCPACNGRGRIIPPEWTAGASDSE